MEKSYEVRAERGGEEKDVYAVVRAAFGQDDEARLVEALRRDPAFVAGLSLVAVDAGRVVGHLLMTRAAVETAEGDVECLALAPMAVVPGLQRCGVGSLLVERGLAEARGMGHALVVVLGHPEYYPRFGFEQASGYGVRVTFEAPEEAVMVMWLDEGERRVVDGVVRYAGTFLDL